MSNAAPAKMSGGTALWTPREARTCCTGQPWGVGEERQSGVYGKNSCGTEQEEGEYQPEATKNGPGLCPGPFHL